MDIFHQHLHILSTCHFQSYRIEGLYRSYTPITAAMYLSVDCPGLDSIKELKATSADEMDNDKDTRIKGVWQGFYHLYCGCNLLKLVLL